MATSFINEHSVEFSLVPYLKKELEKNYNFVLPLFPWLNRETGKLSQHVHYNDAFKILVMFPRRPKLEQVDGINVYVTINKDLLSFKEFANDQGVPVIAGCPIATNFWELSKCTNYAWIEINKKATNAYLNQINGSSSKKVIKKLSISSIVKMIDISKTFNMDNFQYFLEKSRDVMPGVFLFGPRYKPTYFLIKYR